MNYRLSNRHYWISIIFQKSVDKKCYYKPKAAEPMLVKVILEFIIIISLFRTSDFSGNWSSVI